MITQYEADIPKEVLYNIPTFDGKPGELNQFLSTMESYSTMYRIHKTDLVMMRGRGKVHKIIHHTLPEDADLEWSVIKRKLTSNYASTQSGIEASVKISKLFMNSEETVGKYLARAKILVKSKLKMPQHGTMTKTKHMHTTYATGLSKQACNPGCSEDYPSSSHTRTCSTT